MAIWAIADLHLATAIDKPMDKFGPLWENHKEKIKKGWDSVVGDDDLVVIPGDISWAMDLSEVIPDLEWLENLPGTKLLIRGNHDYWWGSLKKVKEVLPPDFYLLQNDHFIWEEHVICGCRGWICPSDPRFEEEKDRRIYLRELQRLELSLKSVKDWEEKKIIAAMHFPPFSSKDLVSGFTEILNAYKVKMCIYGHLHAEGQKVAFEGKLEGVKYIFTAADYLDFKPALIVV